MTILSVTREQAVEQSSLISWRQAATGIWVADSPNGQYPIGIVSERRRGLFSIISSTGADLGVRETLESAQQALEAHSGFAGLNAR